MEYYFGLAAACKHTIGGIAIICVLIYDILRKFYYKENVKFSDIFRKICGIFIVGILYMIWLIKNGALNDFIDLCIGGMFDFGKKNLNGSFWVSYTIIPVALIFISFIFSRKNNLIDKKIPLFLTYSIPCLFIIFPLANVYHTVLVVLGVMPLIAYWLNLIVEKYLDDSCKAISIPLFIMFILISFSYIIQGIITLSTIKTNNDIYEYQYIFFNDERVEKIKKIDEYILQKESEGYNVYILSSDAGLYMIPLGRNNNKLDLIFKGNLGYKGEERLIEDLKKIEKPLFLKSEEMFWQESEMVDNFVKENYKVVDEIYHYKVYSF